MKRMLFVIVVVVFLAGVSASAIGAEFDISREFSSSADVPSSNDDSSNKKYAFIHIDITVTSGDCLWNIARQIKKNTDIGWITWEAVYSYGNNGEIIGDNPRLIHPGMKFKFILIMLDQW